MKIICIGRNYRDHIKEFDNGTPNTEPMFFMKPDTALLRNNDTFWIPPFSQEIDYETELVIKINRVGKCISEKFAHRYYDEVGLGIDFTARDIQRSAISSGQPWEVAKSFDSSAAISSKWLKLDELTTPAQALMFEMTLNGELRQKGNAADMIFSIDKIISYVSQFISLRIGDLIYTGTPAGVGRVSAGDHIKATLMGETLLDFNIK